MYLQNTPIVGSSHKIVRDKKLGAVSRWDIYSKEKMKSYIHTVDESDRSSLIATEVQNFMGSNPRVRGNESTNKTHMHSRLTLECFFLEVFPSAYFTKTLLGWGDPDNKDDVEFHPMTYHQLTYLLTIMTADAAEPFQKLTGTSA